MKRSIWHSPATWISGLILAAGVIAFSLSGSERASAQASPPLTVFESKCYRSIALTDDILCIGRYQLPQQTTVIPTPVAGSEAWCLELVNQIGCDTDPVDPEAPTSLITGKAFVTLCSLTFPEDGCFSAATPGILYGQEELPRIHYGLTGIYLNPGHGIAWDDTSVNLCVESGTAFVPTATDCVPTAYSTADNNEVDQRADLGADLPGLLMTIQSQRRDPDNFLVVNGKLSTAGRILALEAYPFMDRVAPDAFQAVAISPVQTPFSAALTPSPLQQSISATATAVAWANFDAAGAEIAGIGGSSLVLIIFGGMGLIVGGIVYSTTQQVPVSLIAVAPFLAVGMYLGGPSPAGIGVLIFLLAVPAAQFVLRRFAMN